jgi:DNA-binding transcriptional LysR family regulator
MQLSDRIGRRIKLHDLHVLMAVVQAGSMNKAAVLLHTTQPAVSRSITELERTIGVRLLDRNPRGVEPTEYGRALLDGGAAMFDELHLAVKNIECLADPTTGDVRIACNPILATSFLSAVVDRLSRRYPRIAFHINVRPAEFLHRELSERNVDLLVARQFGDLADERLNFETLFADAYVIAAGAQNPLTRRRRIELAELVNEPWTLPPPDHALGAVAREAFRVNGLDYPRVTVAAASPEMRISLLATGHFLSILAETVLRFPAGWPEVRILPVKVPVAPVPVGIVTLKNRTLSPAARLFIDCAREVAKPLAKPKR